MGKEFKTEDAEGLFAGTAPLDALIPLLSGVATLDNTKTRMVFMINDVSRTLFEEPMQKNLCIELPENIMSGESTNRDMVGHLNHSLYGTLDAAVNFRKKHNKSWIE